MKKEERRKRNHTDFLILFQPRGAAYAEAGVEARVPRSHSCQRFPCFKSGLRQNVNLHTSSAARNRHVSKKNSFFGISLSNFLIHSGIL